VADNSNLVKVAVIGCGYFGSLHAGKYAALETANLVAVCDTDPAAAQRCADANQTNSETDYRRLIGNVDAAVIVSPTSFHHEIAKEFLEAGIDIFVEKPLCPTLKEADDLIERAAKNNSLLQVGHLERFSPIIRAIKKQVIHPLFIESHRLSQYRGRGTDTTVILDMMIHDLDHILTIANSPIHEIQAVGATIVSTSEDFANARLTFENGVAATVTASRISGAIQRTMNILEKDSYITADMAENCLVIGRPNTAEESPTLVSSQETFDQTDLLMLQAESFVSSVMRREQPFVSGESVRPVLAAALDITARLRQSV
jgi:predicted dehydrogenase